MLHRTVVALLTATVLIGGSAGAATTAVPDPRTQTPTEKAATASSSFPGSNGRIAYTQHWRVLHTPGPDERSAIFTVRPDGTGNKRLTFSRDASNPKWSPSGRRIAFDRPGFVWVMKADGSGKTELTEGELVGWMPNGRRVLVVRGLDGGAVDPTWVLHTLATGAEEELPIDLPLVAGIDAPYPDYSEWSFAAEPTLSPDGDLLALVLRRYDDGDDQYGYYFGSFFTVRLDGTDLTMVGDYYDYSSGAPEWSPDGDELVYWTSEPRSWRCQDDHLRSIGLDGSPGAVTITKPCTEDDPVWSPNGKKILFASSGTLKVANLAGTRIRTVLPAVEGVSRKEPDWQRVP